jgi:hypothetical protein
MKLHLISSEPETLLVRLRDLRNRLVLESIARPQNGVAARKIKDSRLVLVPDNETPVFNVANSIDPKNDYLGDAHGKNHWTQKDYLSTFNAGTDN